MSYNSGACGGNFTTQNGLITSPTFPNRFPHNADCVYTISLPEVQGAVKIKFLMFNIELCSSSIGHSDYLEIRDGNSEEAPILATLCGSEKIAPVISNHNTLWMR